MMNVAINTNNGKKIFYTVLMVFFTLLISSYENVLNGGVILYSSPVIYYFAITIIQISLIYMLINSKTITNLDKFVVFFSCISIMLLLLIVPGSFPADLDSITSIQSVGFLLNHGFSQQLLTPNLYILATYAMPTLSILAGSTSLVTGLSYITISKYVVFFIGVLSLLFIYLLISNSFSNRTALTSLILLVSFPSIMWLGSGFSNAMLGYFLFFMFMYLLMVRMNKNYTIFIILQVLILIVFTFSHHLSLVILLFIISAMQLYKYALNKSLLKKSKGYLVDISLINLAIITAVLSIGYYSFVYSIPLEYIIKTLSAQLILEGRQGITHPVQSWSFSIIFQRVSWVVMIIFTALLTVMNLRKEGLKKFLQSKEAIFLFLSGLLFLLSIFVVIMGSPFGWDRINVFGWVFLIPVSILLYQKLADKSFVMKTGFIIICGFLILANISSNSTILLDHSGDNVYSKDYKYWINAPEYDSVGWLIQNKNINDSVIGDSVIIGAYLSNQEILNAKLNNGINYNGFSQLITSDYNNIRNQNFKYIAIRKENFYRILGTNNVKISYSTFNNMNANLNLIYDNHEVFLFWR